MCQRLDKQIMKRPQKMCTKIVRRTLACFYISVLEGKRRDPPSFAFPPWSTQLELRRLTFLTPGTEHLEWLPALYSSLVTFRCSKRQFLLSIAAGANSTGVNNEWSTPQQPPVLPEASRWPSALLEGTTHMQEWSLARRKSCPVAFTNLLLLT